MATFTTIEINGDFANEDLLDPAIGELLHDVVRMGPEFGNAWLRDNGIRGVTAISTSMHSHAEREAMKGISDAERIKRLERALSMCASFIENVADDDPERNAKFFACREAWREALR